MELHSQKCLQIDEVKSKKKIRHITNIFIDLVHKTILNTNQTLTVKLQCSNDTYESTTPIIKYV